MDRVIVTKGIVGIYSMQVCCVKDATDEEIIAVCDRENPAGTTFGWSRVERESPPIVPCEKYNDRIHMLVDC